VVPRWVRPSRPKAGSPLRDGKGRKRLLDVPLSREGLLGDSAESREVGATAAHPHPVARVRFFDEAGREKDLLAEGVDIAIRGPGAAARLGVPDRLGLLPEGGERLHSPALVGPDGVDLEDIDDLRVALRAVERAEARGGTVEVTAQVYPDLERESSSSSSSS
jgi:hypothetical protein